MISFEGVLFASADSTGIDSIKWGILMRSHDLRRKLIAYAIEIDGATHLFPLGQKFSGNVGRIVADLYSLELCEMERPTESRSTETILLKHGG